MQIKSTKSAPANAKLIAKMVELGNLGQNVRITGETKAERLKKFREVYYGSKNSSHCHTK